MRYLAIALVLGALASPGLAFEVRDGDRVRVTLERETAPRELVLPAAAGSSLRLRLSGGVDLVVLDPDGRPLHAAGPDGRGKTRVDVSSLPVTGSYRLLLSGDGDAKLKIGLAPPRKIRIRGALTAGQTELLDFAATAGTRLDVKVKGSDGLLPDLPVAEIPGDGEVPLRPVLLGSRVRIHGIPVPGLGRGSIALTARGEEGGSYRAKIKVHPPGGRRTIDLPDRPDETRLPGVDHLVLGEDQAWIDGEPADLRVRAARVHHLLGRGPDDSPQERIGIVVELESTEGGLLAWVLIRLRRPADLRPGTIGLRDDRIEMLHVVTNFRGLLYSSVVSAISGPREGAITFSVASAEEGREVRGLLDGRVERARDGRVIELRDLPIRALVEEVVVEEASL